MAAQAFVQNVDEISGVSGSEASISCGATAGSKVLRCSSVGDFAVGQYVAIDHGGAPCTIVGAHGTCGSLDTIEPTLTPIGGGGALKFCVKISVMDEWGGYGATVTPPGGACIPNAHAPDAFHYVKVSIPLPGRAGVCGGGGTPCAGINSFILYDSWDGATRWHRRGVFNYPTIVNPTVVDDRGPSRALTYDQATLPYVDVTRPQLPPIEDYWWIADEPPTADRNDWLLTRIDAVNGTTLTISDPLQASVSDAKVNHDDGPPIERFVETIFRKGWELRFGPHHYRIFALATATENWSRAFITLAPPKEDPELRSNVRLTGAGPDKSVIDSPPCTTHGNILDLRGPNPAHQVHDVAVDGLGFRGHSCGFLANEDNGKGGIALQNTNHVTISNCKIKDYNYYNLAFVGVVNYVSVRDTENSGGWGDPFHSDCYWPPSCPSHLSFDHYRQLAPGADAPFSIINSLACSDAQDCARRGIVPDSRDVRIRNSLFVGGMVFGGCMGCSLANSTMIDLDGRMMPLQLARNTGAGSTVWGNSDLDIHDNTLMRLAPPAWDRGFNGMLNPIVMLGNPNSGDPFPDSPPGKSRFTRFHDNLILGLNDGPKPMYMIIECMGDLRIYNNDILDYSEWPNGNIGIYHYCDSGVAPRANVEQKENHFSGVGYSNVTKNRQNAPDNAIRMTQHDYSEPAGTH